LSTKTLWTARKIPSIMCVLLIYMVYLQTPKGVSYFIITIFWLLDLLYFFIFEKIGFYIYIWVILHYPWLAGVTYPNLTYPTTNADCFKQQSYWPLTLCASHETLRISNYTFWISNLWILGLTIKVWPSYGSTAVYQHIWNFECCV